MEKMLATEEEIALRAYNRQYLCAEMGGGREVVANRNEAHEWETFRLIGLGNGSVALKAHNGQYVCAEMGGGRELVANRNEIHEWETFELIGLGNGKVAFKAHNGQYVCAEMGGGREVVANRNEIHEWETFELIELEEVKTPDQPGLPKKGKLLDIGTRICVDQKEKKANIRITAHIFTNNYKVYDDIGASTRLELEKKRPISQKAWWWNIDGHNSVRAFFTINDDLGQSIVCHEAHNYQFDNYVSARAIRFGIQIGGEVGKILDPTQYNFKMDGFNLDLRFWEKDWKGILADNKFKFPIKINFPKDKARQFNGVIAFHAASSKGQEFRIVTSWNVTNKIVVPEQFRNVFDYYIKW